MPKRYPDASPTMLGDRVQRKTERSHEENQERAYIAASRRADRSIEARVQSARMASEIHKRRTGKGFKISEEIVMKEEMYEEEEDDLPRYRALAALQHPNSVELNERLSHYITNEFAMSKLARMREIDRQFEESFPNASRMSHGYQVPQPEPMQQQPQQQPQQPQQQHHEPPHRGYSHSPMLDYAAQMARDRAQSISQASPAPDMTIRRHTIAATVHHQTPHHLQPTNGNGDDTASSSLSPPALTPGSGSSSSSSSNADNRADTPMTTQVTPNFSTSTHYEGIPAMASDPFSRMHMTSGMSANPYEYNPSSGFSLAESDQDIQMMGGGWSDSNNFYREPQGYQPEMELGANVGYSDLYDYQQGTANDNVSWRAAAKARPPQPVVCVTGPGEDYFSQSTTITAGPPLTRYDGLSGQRSVAGTPGGGDSFEAFFDMEQYSAAANSWNNHQG